jgi:broad specificity phosphatase PhoE
MDSKGNFSHMKITEQLMNFEKERAKWEHEKSYLLSQKEDAIEAQQRLQTKVESLLRENEKYKNDLRANRKNMY